MPSDQAIGKMLNQATDNYADKRDHLYRQYALDCECLFERYLTNRKIIFEKYFEVIERLEWNHARKCEPIDYRYVPDPETLDKDIGVDHASSYFEFDEGRSNADSNLVTELNRLYCRYREERQDLDRVYHVERMKAYTVYKTTRNKIENEGRG